MFAVEEVRRIKRSSRTGLAAILSLIGCLILKNLPGVEFTGKVESMCIYMLMFLNFCELLKERNN